MQNHCTKQCFGPLQSTGLEKDMGKKLEGSGQGRSEQRRKGRQCSDCTHSKKKNNKKNQNQYKIANSYNV